MITTVVNVRDLSDDWTNDPAYVYVGRTSTTDPGIYGNRHRIGVCFVCNRNHDRYESVALHAAESRERFATDPSFRAAVEKLRGKYLVCHCKRSDVEVPCHADVYPELLGESVSLSLTPSR